MEELKRTHGRSGYVHGMVHGGIAKEQAIYFLGKREGGKLQLAWTKRRLRGKRDRSESHREIKPRSWLVGLRSFDHHLKSHFGLPGPARAQKSENDRPCPASLARRARSFLVHVHTRCTPTQTRLALAAKSPISVIVDAADAWWHARGGGGWNIGGGIEHFEKSGKRGFV